MAYEINNPGCAVTEGANTGTPGCAFMPDKIVGAILIPKNKIILTADIPDIIAELQAMTLAAVADRAYPIFRFEEITDNSEDLTVSTFGYGGKGIGKEGRYDWTFRIVSGGLCHQNNLRKFNGTTMKVLLIDSENVIYGTSVPTGMAGLSLDFFYAQPWKAADGSNTTMFNVRFALAKPKELNENVAYVKVDEDVEENVKGLLDLELYQLAVVAGKATIGIRTACDKTDIYGTFETPLAAGGLWTCLGPTGAAVSITSVAANDTLGGWDVNFTGTGVHTIGLTTPALLAAAHIGEAPDNGFEGNTVAVTMPAP